VSVFAADNGVPSLSATQSFWVTVTRPSVTLEALGLQSTGLTLRVTGDSGPDVTLERSTNLVQWSAVLSTNAPTLPLQWTDPGATNAPRGFYRALLGP
jgi:hypothetical protein